MNDTAKRADTPNRDIEMNTELAIEELEKIVAPKLTPTTTKLSSVTKRQDWMPNDRSSARRDGPEPSGFFQFLNLRNTQGGKMKGKHVVQSSLLCAAMMLVVAAGPAQGQSNTFFGQNAGNPTMSGNNNTGLGASALTSNTTGCCNTATGNNALLLNTTGISNTASGDGALYNNTTGNNNTATGRFALISNSNGFDNTATGGWALNNNQTGGENTATGNGALGNNVDGASNTAMGAFALYSNGSGTVNTAIGYGAGDLITGDNNIDIGYVPGVAGESNTIRIGNSDPGLPFVNNRTFIAGISGVNVTGAAVMVNSAGQLGTMSSSRRFKDDIQDMGEASSDLMKLRPVTFRYKQAQEDGSHPLQYGLVAEEVAEVNPGLVQFDKDGQPQTVLYHVLPSLLLNEAQKQHQQIEAQQTVIQSQQEQIRLQQEQLKAQEERLRKLEAIRSSK